MTKTLAILVTTPPHHNFTATALTVCKAALENPEVKLLGVFFYQDGVLNASHQLAMPNDELQACKGWKKLYQEHQVPLYLCITAAEKRGLSDELNGIKSPDLINQAFTVAGLGELASLTAQADRLLQL